MRWHAIGLVIGLGLVIGCGRVGFRDDADEADVATDQADGDAAPAADDAKPEGDGE